MITAREANNILCKAKEKMENDLVAYELKYIESEIIKASEECKNKLMFNLLLDDSKRDRGNYMLNMIKDALSTNGFAVTNAAIVDNVTYGHDALCFDIEW